MTAVRRFKMGRDVEDALDMVNEQPGGQPDQAQQQAQQQAQAQAQQRSNRRR
jgi:hypothetical protein